MINKELFDKVAYAYKHGEGTPVAIGSKIFVSFPDEKTGHYTKTVRDTIILLHCNEVTERCLDRNEKGEIEYWGDIDAPEYRITLRPLGGPGFYDEYHPGELVDMKINKEEN